MLGPHNREHTQFSQIGLASQNVDDLFELVLSQIVLRKKVFNLSGIRVHSSYTLQCPHGSHLNVYEQ